MPERPETRTTMREKSKKFMNCAVM
jgi:hypothetical protein